MVKHRNVMVQARQVGFAVLLAMLLVSISLMVLQLNVYAGRSAGANGCGTFADAVDLVPEGDFIVPTAPEAGSLNDRPSAGKLITKGILIQGGWSPPPSGCDTANQVFTTTADLLTFGYVFTPDNRSVLTHSGGSVLEINHTGQLTIQNMVLLNQGAAVTQGAGISGTVGGSNTQLLLDNTVISGGVATGAGGGLYVEVRNGARLMISGTQFISNTGGTGGGFEIHVFDNSEVIIHNSQVSSNTAGSGNGGGGRIVIDSGQVTIRNSTFTGNQASGSGNKLSIEGNSGSATVFLFNNNFDSNDPDVNISGNVTVFDQQIFLPTVLKNASFLSAAITNISLSGSTYDVDFTTTGFTPQLPGQHVHFFFDTVPPEEAGVPGDPNNWMVYGGSSPFSGYTMGDRPVDATQMCILVANPDHSVQLGTGNCFDLP